MSLINEGVTLNKEWGSLPWKKQSSLLCPCTNYEEKGFNVNTASGALSALLANVSLGWKV
jgi:hypothetical protein